MVFSLTTLTSLIPSATKILKSKWLWYGVLLVSVLGFVYFQHRQIVAHELEQHAFEIEQKELRVQLQEANLARQKLLEDIERMNQINIKLEDVARKQQEGLDGYREKLHGVLNSIPTIDTPEEAARVESSVQALIKNSYGCLEKATGNKGSSCSE